MPDHLLEQSELLILFMFTFFRVLAVAPPPADIKYRQIDK